MASKHASFANCGSFFFLNDTATTEIYTLSLHDALPISALLAQHPGDREPDPTRGSCDEGGAIRHGRVQSLRGLGVDAPGPNQSRPDLDVRSTGADRDRLHPRGDPRRVRAAVRR